MNLENIPEEYKAELLELLERREEYKKYNKIEFFKPYDFQLKFYASSAEYKRRFLCAANR